MTYIIVEIGSNFHNYHHCIHSIEQAANVADAVKFQLFDDKTMYGFETGDNIGKFSVDRSWIPELHKCAEENGIDFMCSFFDPQDAKAFGEYVDAHKVASSDMLNIPLFDEIINHDKPIFLSTGGHRYEEVLAICESLPLDHIDLTLMYCESSYPANNTDLYKINLLQQTGLPVGLSDHSTEIYSIPMMAVHLFRVPVIEKHANFCGVTDRPDAPHALDFKQFERMSSAIRVVDAHLNGDESLFHFADILSPEEEAMRTNHNRRLTAIKNIKKGDKMVYGENYGFNRYRGNMDHVPLGYGYTEDIEGTVSFRRFKKGDPITLENV